MPFRIKRPQFFVCLIGLSIVLFSSGCAVSGQEALEATQSGFAPMVARQGTEEVPNTPTPTNTVAPSATPTPTQSPSPTNTLTPSPTETQIPTETNTPEPTFIEPISKTVQVIAEFPHDSTHFTQGLLLHNDLFYESGGLFNESSINIIDPSTGATILTQDLPGEIFAEGLARVDDRLIQLTWKAGIAYIRDIETLDEIGQFSYLTEGWGLCYDGESLWMSDGSSTIFRRDPVTFEQTGSITVTNNGMPVVRLNELECVGDLIYANVWLTDQIVAFEKESGQIRELIDASNLLTIEEETALSSNDVLNGIAYDPEADIFYLTGKRWPKLFSVVFVETE